MTTYVNWNGQLRTEQEPIIATHDRGYLLGDGLFETMRYYGDLPIKSPLRCFDLHWQRLMKSAALLQLNLSITSAQLAEHIIATLSANQLQHQSARIRITISRGVGQSGLLPDISLPSTILITTHAFQANLTPFRLMIATTRRNEHSVSAKIKSLSYIDNVLARLEAEQHQADEAILCNSKGHIASTSYHTLFAVLKGQIITPPIHDGALPGIARQIILDLAHKKSLPLYEQTLYPQDLLDCDELFLSNSLHGIRAVNQLNQRPLTTHDWTKKITDYYTQWLHDEHATVC